MFNSPVSVSLHIAPRSNKSDVPCQLSSTCVLNGNKQGSEATQPADHAVKFHCLATTEVMIKLGQASTCCWGTHRGRELLLGFQKLRSRWSAALTPAGDLSGGTAVLDRACAKSPASLLMSKVQPAPGLGVKEKRSRYGLWTQLPRCRSNLTPIKV